LRLFCDTSGIALQFGRRCMAVIRDYSTDWPCD